MSTVWAVKSGNWSDPTVWNTGGLPATTDDVYTNNYTVTIDTSVSVRSITNKAATGITAGGVYVLNGGVTFTSSLEVGGSIGAGAYPVMTYAANSPDAATINANLYCVPSSGVGPILLVTGTGTLNIVGNIRSNFGSGNSAVCITVTGAATINIAGNVSGGSSGNRYNYALYTNAALTLNITGNVSGAPENSGSDLGNMGLYLDHGLVVVTITGVVTGACSSGHGVYMPKGGILTVTGPLVATYGSWSLLTGVAPAVSAAGAFITHTGTIFACGTTFGGILLTAGSSALYAAGGTTILTGPFINAANGNPAIYITGHMFLVPTLNNYWQWNQYTIDGSGATTYLYSSDKLADVPAPANVRYGTTYANSTLTGTCRIPPANQVRYGKAVDATVGTAALTAADVWNYAVSNGFSAGSIGERLKLAATTDTTGAQLAALG